MAPLRAGLGFAILVLLAPALHAADDTLPKGATARLGSVRGWHPAWVESLAFSPDGKTVACAASNDAVYLWDVATLQAVGELKAGSRVRQIVWLPSGQHVLALLESGVVECLPVRGGMAEWSCGSGEKGVLAVSPDGKWFAVGYKNGKTELYDLKTRKCVRTWDEDNDHPVALAFAHDSTQLAVGFHQQAWCVWDVATGKRLHLMRLDPWYTPLALSVAFAPDGKHLLTSYHHQVATSAARIVRWKLGDKDPVVDRIFSDSPVFLDPRGGWFLVRNASAFEIHDVDNKVKPVSLLVEPELVQRWAASPDGETVAAVGRGNRLRLWSRRTGKLLHEPVGHTHPVACLCLSHDGQSVYTTDDQQPGVTVWDAATGKVRTTIDVPRTLSLALSPDGKQLVACGVDRKIRQVDLQEPDPKVVRGESAYLGSAVTFYRGQQQILFTYEKVELFLPGVGSGLTRQLCSWNLRTGAREEIPFEERDDEVQPDTATLSPDGRWIASWGCNGPVVVWDARSGRRTLRFGKEQQFIRQTHCSPDSRLLAIVAGDGVFVLETATGIERQVLKANGPILSAVWLPSGRGLVLGHADGSLTVRDVLNGRCVEKRTAHGGEVRVLALSGDGKTLASGGDDGTVLLWPTPTPAFTPDRVGGLSAKQVRDAWDALGSTNGPRATKAILDLSEDPPRALAHINEQFLSAKSLSMEEVQRLFAALDDDRFVTRQQATAQLASLGKSIEPALAELRRTTPSAEVRSRTVRVQEQLDALTHDAEWLRQARAIEVLERMGTAEARQCLETLAKQPEWTTWAREARAALKRLEERR